jgi:hypothetical protein
LRPPITCFAPLNFGDFLLRKNWIKSLSTFYPRLAIFLSSGKKNIAPASQIAEKQNCLLF